MLCSHCGSGHSGEARFCAKCGALLPSGGRQKITQPRMRALSGTPRRISARGFTPKARTLTAERLKAKYHRLGWIFIRREEARLFSSQLLFLAPRAPGKQRSSSLLGVGIALAGVLSVAVFGLSGASSTIVQILEERRQLLPQSEQRQAAQVAETIRTSIAPEPQGAIRAAYGPRTTREADRHVERGAIVSQRSAQKLHDGELRDEKLRDDSVTSVARAAAPRVPIIIASDSNAEYFVVERTTSGRNPTLVVERVGPSGVTYTKRVFDCRRHKFKYLGGGDTLAALDVPAPPREMGLLFEGSISDYWWHHACRKPRHGRP